MGQWDDFNTSDSVPDSPDFAGWDIMRAPPAGSLSLVALSEHFTGVYTHFWGGRTIPCRRRNCPAHDAGHSARWRGYLLCEVPSTGKGILLEFPEGVGKTLAEEKATHGTLRGLCFRIGRTKGRANGRVVVTPVKRLPKNARLRKADDIRAILSKIWGLTPEGGSSAHGTGDSTPE